MRMRFRSGQTTDEYAGALLDGVKIGIAGVTEMLDGLIVGGITEMELVDVRSAVEQLRMRTALNMDAETIVAQFRKSQSGS